MESPLFIISVAVTVCRKRRFSTAYGVPTPASVPFDYAGRLGYLQLCEVTNLPLLQLQYGEVLYSMRSSHRTHAISSLGIDYTIKGGYIQHTELPHFNLLQGAAKLWRTFYTASRVPTLTASCNGQYKVKEDFILHTEFPYLLRLKVTVYREGGWYTACGVTTVTYGLSVYTNKLFHTYARWIDGCRLIFLPWGSLR